MRTKKILKTYNILVNETEPINKDWTEISQPLLIKIKNWEKRHTTLRNSHREQLEQEILNRPNYLFKEERHPYKIKKEVIQTSTYRNNRTLTLHYITVIVKIKHIWEQSHELIKI